MIACKAFLFAWCVILPVVGDSGSESVPQVGPGQRSSTVAEPQPVETDSTRHTLDFWIDCPEQSRNAPSLCRSATAGIDQSAEAKLRNLLSQDISEMSSLCAIDASLIRSQRECLGESVQQDNAVNLSQLMVSLANEWSRNGVIERAEQLFTEAYGLISNSDERFDMFRSATLLAWTKFEMERSNLEQAYELAALNTAKTRKLYEEWPYQWWLLENALALEASILERLYRIDEAQAKREELAELVRSPSKAKTCWRNRDDRVTCRAEPTKIIVICDGGSNGKEGKCWADEAL
jgi:hypothetical protein